MFLSIIIPVYNEEKTVGAIIKKVYSVKLPKEITSREIIVVNDGSTDQTPIVLSQNIVLEGKPAAGPQTADRIPNIILLTHRTNRGKGAAIKTALKRAKGDIVLIQDADLEYDPKDYPRLLSPILKRETQVVYGTRFQRTKIFIRGKNNPVLLVNRAANKFLTALTNILYGSKITDMETCYKICTRHAISKIKLHSDRFTIEPEITAKLLRLGYKITEVSIVSHPRSKQEGKKITWKDGTWAIWALMKYRFID